MIGTIVNSISIILGSILGLFIKGGIPERVSTTIMQSIALCVIYIGISGSLEIENPLLAIICMASGAFLGELIDIDKYLNILGNKLESKLSKFNNSNISKGFVSATLISCIGAMSIVGALESGINNNHDILFTKSMLDGITCIILSASLGIGVIFSSISVLLYQGTITIFASGLSTLLSEVVISQMSSIGSLLIVGLGLNVLGVSNIKIANLLPSMFIPIILGIF